MRLIQRYNLYKFFFFWRCTLFFVEHRNHVATGGGVPSRRRAVFLDFWHPPLVYLVATTSVFSFVLPVFPLCIDDIQTCRHRKHGKATRQNWSWVLSRRRLKTATMQQEDILTSARNSSGTGGKLRASWSQWRARRKLTAAKRIAGPS